MCTGFGFQEFSFVEQTSSISTTLFTPSEDGEYTIFAYGQFDNGAAGSAFSATLGWTDDYRSESVSYGLSNGQSENYTPTTIHAKAGQPVTFDLTYTPGTGSIPYSVFLTVIGLS